MQELTRAGERKQRIMHSIIEDFDLQPRLNNDRGTAILIAASIYEVHEMAHLIEPTHNERFASNLDRYYPQWRDARAELNDLPLAAEKWKF